MELVTGGTGFLGSYIIRELLAQGRTVRATRRASSRMNLLEDVKDRIEWFEADVLDVLGLEEAMEGVDRVYDSAAVIGFEASDRDWMMKVNGEGTANVVNAALHTGVKHLLHVSSVAALGRQPKLEFVDETVSWKNDPANTSYAISKFLAEQEVWRGIEEGLKAVIVNPAVILGHAQWNSGSGMIFTNIYEGLKFYTNGINGFVAATDVAKIGIQLVDAGISGERYIASAQNLSYLEAFAMVAKGFDKPIPTIELKPWMQEMAWRAEWLRSKITGSKPLATKETLQTAAMRIKYDNSKVVKALNYEFMPVEEAIEEGCKAFLKDQA